MFTHNTQQAFIIMQINLMNIEVYWNHNRELTEVIIINSNTNPVPI